MIDNEHERKNLWRELESKRATRHLRKQEVLWDRISSANIVASLYGAAFFIYASSGLFSSWFSSSLKLVGTGILMCGVVVNIVSTRRLGRCLEAFDEELVEERRLLDEYY